jgi:hypothetical protein
MSRLYTPLLPLALLAAIVAASACSRNAHEAETRLIPPAAPLAAAAEPAATPSPSGAIAAAPAKGDEKPSAEDVKEFNRKVMK